MGRTLQTDNPHRRARQSTPATTDPPHATARLLTTLPGAESGQHHRQHLLASSRPSDAAVQQPRVSYWPGRRLRWHCGYGAAQRLQRRQTVQPVSQSSFPRVGAGPPSHRGSMWSHQPRADTAQLCHASDSLHGQWEARRGMNLQRRWCARRRSWLEGSSPQSMVRLHAGFQFSAKPPRQGCTGSPPRPAAGSPASTPLQAHWK